MNNGQTQFFIPVAPDLVSGGTAAVLDSLLADTSGLPADLTNILTTLRNQSDSQRASAVQRITPNTSVAVTSASANVVSGSFSEIGGRLGAIRGFQNSGSVTTGVSAGDKATEESIWDRLAQPNSFWGQVYGHMGKQRLDDGFAGYKSISKSMMFGYDVIPAQNWVVGAALGYANTDVDMIDFREGDETSIDSYQFSLYGSYAFAEDWALDTILSYARHEYESERNTSQDIAKGDFGGNHYGVRADVSRTFDLPYVTLVPKVGAEWTTLKVEGYDETESALAQHNETTTTHRLKSIVSVEVRKEYQTSETTKLVPSLRLGWDHQFKDRGTNSTSSFTGGGDSFTTQGQTIGKNSFNIRTGVEIHKQENLQLDFALDAEFAEKYRGYGAQLQVKWKF